MDPHYDSYDETFHCISFSIVDIIQYLAPICIIVSSVRNSVLFNRFS